jgi:mannose-6-phosphate isomerase-like protein (cupin superfamily)
VGRLVGTPLRFLLTMKSKLLLFAGLVVLAPMLSAEAPESAKPPEKLKSAVYDWEKMVATPNAKGARRDVFDGATTNLDQLHCHITTLNPGENSGEPRLHLQEEVIIVKEGRVEMHIDGKDQTAGPGSVFYLAAHATTRLRNAGTTPATYIVIYYTTPLTPKS